MGALLEDGLRAGALGLSSGLFTAPGSYAAPDEMIALCHVVKRHNAGYFTHIRDEANNVHAAVDEAIAVAEVCAIHVEIVHFKCSGVDNWGGAAQALAKIAAAKARGVDVDCDAYPYTAGSNPLKNLLPQWVQAGGVPAMLERLRLPETRARIRPILRATGSTTGDGSRTGIACRFRFPRTCRNTPAAPVADLARERQADPIDVVCDYLIEDKGATRVLVTSISEDDVREHPALAAGARGLRRQLRGRSRHHQPGSSASALLRHLPAYPGPLRARALRASARARDPQDDRQPLRVRSGSRIAVC